MTRQISIGIVSLFLLSAAGTVEAAKGEKKVGSEHLSQTVSGRVLNVTRQKDGSGTIQVSTGRRRPKQNQNGAAGAKPQHSVRQFSANGSTRLTTSTGSPASPNALQRGARVRVQAKGNQASNVQILGQTPTRGQVTRARTMAYHPQANRQSLHPNHHSNHHHQRRR